jgi:bifunctional pyridoxal-dependent enzyme with beta-cystathionase and maltose regulon repressor activities
VRIAPGSRFGVGGAFERFIRLPYALPTATLTVVVDRLVEAWGQVVNSSARRTMSADERLTEAI